MDMSNGVENTRNATDPTKPRKPKGLCKNLQTRWLNWIEPTSPYILNVQQQHQ